MMSPYGIATHFVICRRLNIPSPESAHDQECIVFSQYDQVGGKGKNKLLIYPSLPPPIHQVHQVKAGIFTINTL
jgi:hypothetical protein